jgi:chloramphenicol 3-O phosphotransferase
MISGQKNDGLEFRKLEEGFYRCVKSLSELGHDLIIDNAIVSIESARLLVTHLGDQDVVMIGISCDLGELNRRETKRGDRTRGDSFR